MKRVTLEVPITYADGLTEKLWIDTEKELVIVPEELDTKICEHASLLAFWCQMAALKRYELNMTQAALKSTKAQTEMLIRVSPETYTPVKITEAVVAALVDKDVTVNALVEATIKLKREVELLDGLVEGYKANTALITTLGARKRAELDAYHSDTVKETKSTKPTKFHGLPLGRGSK